MGKVSYLAILKPREPYTFSTDQKSPFLKKDEVATGKESYFIESNIMPEQTTIWGMMRLLLIEQSNLMKSDFNYDESDIQEIHKMVGAESFSFDNDQTFGQLDSISPVFICKINKENKYDYIVSNPLCNTAKPVEDVSASAEELTEKKKPIKFTPYKMNNPVNYADGKKISLPIGYDSKKGCVSGFVNLSTGEVIKRTDIFSSIVQTNSHKNEAGKLAEKKTDSGGFFKRERYTMKEGFCLAFFVSIDEEFKQDLRDDLVTIGAGKNVFSIHFIKDVSDNLEEKVQAYAPKSDTVWHYALSDIVFKGKPDYNEFAIVQFRYLRNIKTDYNKATYNERFKRSDSQVKIIQRGSVFYHGKESVEVNTNANKLGYNRIVEIGGK